MRLLRIGEAAVLLFGESTLTTQKRTRKLVDDGVLGHVRVGQRRDRLVPSSEIDRVLREAEASRAAAS